MADIVEYMLEIDSNLAPARKLMTYICYFRNYYDLFLCYLTTLFELHEFKRLNGSSENAKDRLI
jgi:hypothetical protein